MMTALRDDALKNLGGILAPALAYNFIRGLKTLDVRMKVHCQNAMQVAQFLESHPKIERVYYPGLPSHPQHELATRQMYDFGGIVCCELRGGIQAGITLMESVKLCVLGRQSRASGNPGRTPGIYDPLVCAAGRTPQRRNYRWTGAHVHRVGRSAGYYR